MTVTFIRLLSLSKLLFLFSLPAGRVPVFIDTACFFSLWRLHIKVDCNIWSFCAVRWFCFVVWRLRFRPRRVVHFVNSSSLLSGSGWSGSFCSRSSSHYHCLRWCWYVLLGVQRIPSGRLIREHSYLACRAAMAPTARLLGFSQAPLPPLCTSVQQLCSVPSFSGY